jgi:hypothetical protein
MKTTRPHFVPSELYRIEAIRDSREKVHAIRELKSQWRNDPKSAFNDTAHADHKSAVDAMNRLYNAEAEFGPMKEDPQE